MPGTPVADMFPSLRGRYALAFVDPADAHLDACDVVFFATPHGVAMAEARELVTAGARIIDLAADFRLKDPAVFMQWYGMPHACPDLLAASVYGLPEVNRAAIRDARIVGNPGCYPTAVQLGFLPLLEAGIVDAAHLVADCKSGVSGAGRKAELGLLFAEASDNFKAYGVKGHRHHPEIVQGLNAAARAPVSLVFTPHLVPMIRGIHATLYARLTDTTCRPADAVRTALRRRAFRRRDAAWLHARHTLGPRLERLPDRRAPAAGQRHGVGAGRRGQSRQGRRRPGDPEHEPDVRPAGDHRSGRIGRAAVVLALSVWWRRARQHFSIDAPRMAVRSRLPWPWRAVVGIGLLGVVAGMWWWGFDFGQIFGGVNRREVEARLTALEAENADLRRENAQLRAKAMQQESELAMTTGAQASLSKQALELAAENSQMKEELAFLQQLVADSNKQVGLSIQHLSVEREREDAWSYRLLLVRGGSPKEDFVGHVRLQATVQPMAADGAPARPLIVTLPDDQPGTGGALMLKFKYYQRLEGTIGVPAGSVVRAVTVRVFESGQSGPRATRSLVIP